MMTRQTFEVIQALIAGKEVKVISPTPELAKIAIEKIRDGINFLGLDEAHFPDKLKREDG